MFLLGDVAFYQFLGQCAFLFQPLRAHLGQQALDLLDGDVQALGDVGQGGPVGQAGLLHALLLPPCDDGAGIVRRQALSAGSVLGKRIRVIVLQAHCSCYTL